MPIWAVILVYVLAAAASAALAVPIVSFLFVLFSFGLAYILMVIVGLVALLGPLAILIHAAWVRFRGATPTFIWVTVNLWACAMIVHLGASYGQSHWGDVGGTMGAKNMPYVESFLSPLIFVASRLNIPMRAAG